jgi:hypothetical protein
VYMGHGFQTQGTGATVVDLKVRPESTYVPRVLGPMVQSVKTTYS